MWLSVEHMTRFSYDVPITEAYTELRLKPVHRNSQRCSSFSLVPEPRGATVAEHVDRFGNTVHHFDVLEQHERISVVARSEVWTASRFAETGQLSPLDRLDLLSPSRYVPLDDRVAELAASTPTTEDTGETARSLMHVARLRAQLERIERVAAAIADERLRGVPALGRIRQRARPPERERHCLRPGMPSFTRTTARI